MQKIGVVILNYNSKSLTVELANKISNYISVSNIVVVDNNSNDEFYLKDFLSSKIVFVQSESNKGYSAGNNIGLKILIDSYDCDFVFIANPDVDFTNDGILEIINAFNQDETIALCSSLRYGNEKEKIHQYFEFQSFRNAVLNCFIIPRRILNRNKVINQTNRIKYSLSNITYVDAVPGAFFALRASFLKRLGYLYEGTFLYYEEFFVGQSARKLGYKSAIVNGNFYYHNHVQKKFSRSNIRMFLNDRKSMILYFKYFNILKKSQILILKLFVFLGTVEYIIIAFLYSLFKGVRRTKK